MNTTFDRMVKAMQASPAWPAVFYAGSARVLLIAALREARMVDYDMLELMEDAADVAVGCPGGSPALAAWIAAVDHMLSEAEG